MKFSVVDGRIFDPGDLNWEGFQALAEVTVTNFEKEPSLAQVIACLQDSQGAMLRQRGGKAGSTGGLPGAEVHRPHLHRI